MILCNYHTHTTYCDGKNTAEEMVRAAIGKGFTRLGFSGHSYMDYNLEYPMSREDTHRYCAEVRDLQKKYAEQIEIYLGLELDYFGETAREPLDFVIGSVHGVAQGGTVMEVDSSREEQIRGVQELFGGDYYAFCRDYFSQMAGLRRKTNCDVVGHFDVVTKFNEKGDLFDTENPRYRKPAMEAAEALCRQGGVFEINTGAMWKGYRTKPYPSEALLRAIHAFGGAVVLSSDSHDCDSIGAFFPEAAQLAKRCGFRTARVLTKKGWEEAPL